MSTKQMLEDLHRVCSETLAACFEEQHALMMNKSCGLCHDLSTWVRVLNRLQECLLYAKAEQEYLTAMLNLAQGQYRNAFKGLRLVLELCLQGIYLSANLVELKEWLNNSCDTNWSKLTNPDTSPLGTRFCKAFFPELSGNANNFLTMAVTVYRELSEAIHGNVPYHLPLPDSFEFCYEVFNLWHEKSETIRLLLTFCFCSRYLKDFSDDNRREVESICVDQLGHIESIRILFGGPRSS